MRKLWILALLIPVYVTSCTVDSSSGTVKITEATFTHGVDEKGNPKEPGDEFAQNEKIFLHLKFMGRPAEGTIKARFLWRDQLIGETSIDFADVNEGIIFSFGQYTYANFHMDMKIPPPIGEGYRAEVFYNDEPLGSYEFKIKQPEDAIPSSVFTDTVTLAKGADENYNPISPSSNFAPTERVYLTGRGDFGLDTWLLAEWFVGDKLDEAATRRFTLEENVQDTGFTFYYLPQTGWPEGEHYVVLTMNGKEIGRYKFTVVKPQSGGLGRAVGSGN
jgi:hypothetical protein